MNQKPIPGAQAYQDLFALKTSKHSTYIEIGGAWPIKYSNTYSLENNKWKGISIELDSDCVKLWGEDEVRKNKIYCDNAITFDYLTALQENNLPTHIGYLSCDIEPVENTFAALKRVIEQGISFDCITFEHDKYRSAVDYDPIVTEYLSSKGYEVAVTDVYVIKKRPRLFETWFVHKSIKYTTVTFDQWKESNVS